MGGAWRPGRLECTYARVPHHVIAEAHRLGMPSCWAVLLMLFTYAGEDGGGLWASCPRSRIAETLGVTEDQVKSAVGLLKKKGVVTVAESGHNGRAGVYRVHAAGCHVGSGPGHYPTGVGCYPGTYPTDLGSGAGPYPTERAAEAESRVVPSNRPYSPVGSGPGPYPKRTSKEVLYRDASSRGHGDPAPCDGGALDAPPARYPKPRVLFPVNAMGARP